MNGKFYVFNPKADKPRKLYDNYEQALNDAKSISENFLAKTYVLQIVATCETETTILQLPRHEVKIND